MSLTRIVLIQHVLEQTEPSNTGRHAAAAWENLELRIFGAQGQPLKVDDLGGAWLLWPGEAEPLANEQWPSTVVVLDGSWSQARRMTQRVPALRGLRKWSLGAPAGRKSLRASPPGGLSTLEAIAEALRQLEGDEVGARVLSVHEALLERQMAARGYVGPYRR